MWAIEVDNTRYTFESLGIRVITVGDTGMPNVENIVQERVFQNGSVFQRNRVPTRFMQIVGQLYGNSLADLHSKRATISRLLANEEIRLIYSGGFEEVYIDARYESGFNFNSTAHWFQDIFTLRFMCTYPFWRSTTTQSVVATENPIEVENQRYLFLYDDVNSQGLDIAWGIDGPVRVIYEASNHDIWIGGDFTGYCKRITPSGTVETITGLNDTVWAIAEIPETTLLDRVIILGGDFTTPVPKICSVNETVSPPAAISPPVGGLNATSMSVRTIDIEVVDATQAVAILFGVQDVPGEHDMYVTLDYTDPAGNWVSEYTGVNPTTALRDRITFDPRWQFSFFLAGNQNEVAKISFLIGGVIVLTAPVPVSPYGDIEGVTSIHKLIDLAGDIYCVGEFTTADGVPASGIARWNGASWTVPFEIDDSVNTPEIFTVVKDKFDNLLVGGSFIIGYFLNNDRRTAAANLLLYNSGLKNCDIDTSPATTINISQKMSANTNTPGVLVGTLGFPITPTSIWLAAKTITVGGTKPGKPIIGGLPNIIINLTTGKRLYFSGAFSSDGWSFDVHTREVKNEFGRVVDADILLPGSDIDTFELVPGENVLLIPAFATATSTYQTSLTYRNEYWGFDT